MIRILSTSLALLLLAFATAGCGGGGDDPPPSSTPGTPQATPTTATSTRTPQPAPDTLTVAYINLGSPLRVDATDAVAAETFQERLQIVVDELRRIEPDVVFLSEATWTRELQTPAWAFIASGLGMEVQFGRANPWFAGQDKNASDATRDLAGFEEGEAILSHFPILESQRIQLNPRTSENEGRIAFHVVIRLPEMGEVNLVAARLSGDDVTREAQAADLARVVSSIDEGRPTIVATDIGPAASELAVGYLALNGYADLAAAHGAEPTDFATCCRDVLLIPGDAAATAAPGSPTPDASPSPAGETPADGETASPTPGPAISPTIRTSLIFCDAWVATEIGNFAGGPVERADGSLLWASDHDGIYAVIALNSTTAGPPAR